MKKHLNREKVNFMISKENMMQLKQLIPAGERSDFINKTLEEAIKSYKRRKASEEMDKLSARLNLKMSTEELIKIKNYGRK
ncbi:hypothetical protein HZA40_01170 [Candidatus Peregrinibacteria bacterium]|nr:hypothetical protein [Candidatus Peregrinibacteria bacterium]